MISDELLKKFDCIEDLPVSEEMLCAYLEGTLDSIESARIESEIFTDSHLSSIVDSIAEDDVTNIIGSCEHQLFDPSCPVIISDLQSSEIYVEAIDHSPDEDYLVAACCPDEFYESENDLLSDNLSSSTDLLEDNFSDDNFF